MEEKPHPENSAETFISGSSRQPTTKTPADSSMEKTVLAQNSFEEDKTVVSDNEEMSGVPSSPKESKTVETKTKSEPREALPSRSPRYKGIMPGEKLGVYEILEEIGSGGMGKVYKAYHPGLDKKVAIKIMLASSFVAENCRERFLTEARLTAKLRHRNIVAIHDVGQIEGLDYIVMDFIEGESLSSLMKRSRLTAQKSLEIIEEIAMAMDYAHQNGIIHRDLKPANVIIEKSTGFPIIMDFGLAKNIDVTTELTRSGEILGTPRYMSPEQAEGKRALISPSTDIYAMGAILYEMLTGLPAVEGDTLINTIYNIIHKEIKPPRNHNADLSEELESVCMKALEKDIQKRYKSARMFAEDMENLVRSSQKSVVSAHKSDRRIWQNKRRAIAIFAFILTLLGTIVFAVRYFAATTGNREISSDRIQKAIEYYKQATVFGKQDDMDKALKSYTLAIQTNPDYTQAYRERATLYYTKGDLEKAIADLTQCIRLEPKNIRLYHDRGVIHYERGEMDASIADNTKALEIDPKFMDAHNNRGLARYGKGDFDGAVADITSAIALTPDDAKLYSNRASIHIAKNDYEKAIGDYTAMIALQPSDANAYYQRAWCLTQQNRTKEAIKDFRQFLFLAPDDPKAKQIESYLRQQDRK